MTVSLETLAAMLTLDVTGFTSGAKKAMGSAKELFDGLGTGPKVAAAGFALATTAVVATGAALYQVGNEFAQAYDTIRVGTGATGVALDGLKESFKNVVSDVPASFEDASSALTQLNQRLDLTGPALEGLTKQFLNLSRITKTDLSANIAAMTRVFGDWTITDQSKALDEMYRASQATGAGLTQLTERVVQFGAPLRGLGFGFEESLALVGKWEKEGVNFGNVMGAMKKAYGEFAKDFGGSAPQEFRKWLDLLAKAPSASQAATMAIEKLGVRNGPDFAAAAREGRFAYADLVDQITNGADTINQAAADTEHFGEKWDRFINQAKVAVEPLASAVFDSVNGLVDKVTPAFNEVTGGITAFVAAFKAGGNDITSAGFAGELEKLGLKARQVFDDISPTISGFADNVLPALKTAWDAAFGAVQTALGWLENHQEILTAIKVELGVGAVIAVYALTSAMVPLVIEMWSLAAAVVAATWPFVLIGVAITALVAGVIWAYNNWGWFRTAVDAVGQALLWVWNSVLVPVGSWIIGTLIPIILNIAGKIAELATNIPQWFGNIPQALGAVVEWFESLPGIVVGFLSSLWTTISTWVVNAATQLPGLIAGWAIAFNSWIERVTTALPGQLAYLAGFVIGWIIGEGVNLAINIAGWATSFFSWIVNVATQLPGWLAGIAGSVWAWITQTASELPGRLLDWYIRFALWATDLAANIGVWLILTAQSMWNWIHDTAAAIPGQVASWLAAFRDWTYNLAVSFSFWFVGVTNSIADWIRGIPGAVSGAVSSAADIGRNIANSIWEGLKGMAGWLRDRATDFARGILDGIKSALHIGSPSKDMIWVGQMMVRGVGVGFESESRNLHRAVDSVMRGVLAKTSGMGDLALGLSAPASSTGLVRSASSLALAGAQKVTIDFGANADSAFAGAFMKMVRSGQIQIRAA